MTTLAALVDDSLAMLYGIPQAERPQEDTLASTVTDDADVSWRWTTEALWKRGDYAEAADSAGELVIMAEDHPAAADITVRRGQRDTTAKAAGYASGDVFYRNPVFSRVEMERMVDQVVRNELWPAVWTWHQDSLSFVAGAYYYPLDAYIDEVEVLYQYDLNSDGRFHPLDINRWSTEMQIDSGIATNGGLLRVRGVFDESEAVYYTAKRRPDPADLANLSAEVAELVPWAVVGKLVAANRVAPIRSRPSTDGDNTEGGTTRDYRMFMAEFLRMRGALNKKLRKEIPADHRYKPRSGRRVY
jgi:hypothetical protein